MALSQNATQHYHQNVYSYGHKLKMYQEGKYTLQNEPRGFRKWTVVQKISYISTHGSWKPND